MKVKELLKYIGNCCLQEKYRDLKATALTVSRFDKEWYHGQRPIKGNPYLAYVRCNPDKINPPYTHLKEPDFVFPLTTKLIAEIMLVFDPLNLKSYYDGSAERMEEVAKYLLERKKLENRTS